MLFRVIPRQTFSKRVLWYEASFVSFCVQPSRPASTFNVFLFVQNLEPYSNVVYKAYTRTLELDHFRFLKKYSSLNGVPELACPPVQMRSANSLQLLINIVVLPYISKVIFNKYTSQLYITMIEIFLVTVTRYVNININI